MNRVSASKCLNGGRLRDSFPTCIPKEVLRVQVSSIPRGKRKNPLDFQLRAWVDVHVDIFTKEQAGVLQGEEDCWYESGNARYEIVEFTNNETFWCSGMILTRETVNSSEALLFTEICILD